MFIWKYLRTPTVVSSQHLHHGQQNNSNRKLQFSKTTWKQCILQVPRISHKLFSSNLILTRINNVNLKIPISHRAPETLEDSRFIEQSDVWSFAVCLYELFSLGDSPFDGLNDMKKCLERVGELQKPEYCHQEM